jgi:hypothetical protein
MLEKIQTYIDNYIKDENKNLINNYLTELTEFHRFKNDMLITKFNNKTNDYILNETIDEYNIKYKNNKIILKKPIYKNIFDEINILKNQKKIKKIEYDDLQYRILYNLNTEKDFKKYNDIVDELTKLDEEIKSLIDCYIQINRDNKIKIDHNANIYNKLIEEQQELYDKILNEKSNIDNKNNIDNYIELKQKQFKITDNTTNNSHLQQIFSNNIDYIIVKLPEIVKTTTKKEKKLEVDKKTKEKINLTDEQKMRKQEKKLIKKINDKLQKTPNGNISKLEQTIRTKLLKEFKFKNEGECGSKAYSADYFIKKSDLLYIIKKYPEVETLLPKDYHKLSKDKICNQLFKL